MTNFQVINDKNKVIKRTLQFMMMLLVCFAVFNNFHSVEAAVINPGTGTCICGNTVLTGSTYYPYCSAECQKIGTCDHSYRRILYFL